MFDWFFRRRVTPPLPLLIDEALRLYLVHAPDLSPATQDLHHRAVRQWRRLGGPEDLRTWTTETFARQRRTGLDRGLAPNTIERCLSSVMAMLRHCGPRTAGVPHGLGLLSEVPYGGRRLSCVTPIRPIVPLDDVSTVYRAAIAVGYCPRPFTGGCALWWRCLLVLAYQSGLRCGDLIALRWDAIDWQARTITVVASKTGKTQVLPVNAVLQRHLEALPRDNDRVLAMSGEAAQRLRTMLRELCDQAGVVPFTLQSLRRTAAEAYELAHPGAGPLLLGHTIPGGARVSFSNYIRACETVLRPASEKIAQPAAFLDEPN